MLVNEAERSLKIIRYNRFPYNFIKKFGQSLLKERCYNKMCRIIQNKITKCQFNLIRIVRNLTKYY